MGLVSSFHVVMTVRKSTHGAGTKPRKIRGNGNDKNPLVKVKTGNGHLVSKVGRFPEDFGAWLVG